MPGLGPLSVLNRKQLGGNKKYWITSEHYTNICFWQHFRWEIVNEQDQCSHLISSALFYTLIRGFSASVFRNNIAATCSSQTFSIGAKQKAKMRFWKHFRWQIETKTWYSALKFARGHITWGIFAGRKVHCSFAFTTHTVVLQNWLKSLQSSH